MSNTLKKLIIYTVLLLIAVPGTSTASTRPCPDPSCGDPVSQAIQAAAKLEEETFGEMAKNTIQDEIDALQACLENIHQYNGISLDIFIPDIRGILGKICEMAVDEVNSRLDEVMGKYTYEALGGIIGGSVSGSESGSSSTVNVKNISGSIVGKLESIIDDTLNR